MCASSRNVNHCSFWGGPVLGAYQLGRVSDLKTGPPPTPPQCRPGLLVLEPLWVWPLLSLQVPFYPYRTCFTIQTYQGLVQLRMTTIGPRKTLGLNLHLRKSPTFTYFFSLPIVNSEGKKSQKKQLMFDLHTSQPQAHQFHNPLRSKC